MTKKKASLFYFALKVFGWLLIVAWLSIYLLVPSFIENGDQRLPNPLSFRHMVIKPSVNFLNDLIIGIEYTNINYIVDAIFGLIAMLIINSPFILGLVIVFPRPIKSIFKTIFFPFKKIILLIKWLRNKNIIVLLENYFGLGFYRLLFVLWWLLLIIGLIFSYDDYFIFLLFIMYWPLAIFGKKIYHWINTGFKKDIDGENEK